MIPLRIRARLVNGYAAKDPWSPTLDGIVAAVVMRARLGDDYAASAALPGAMQPVTGLPFAVEHHGDLWWYAVSSPIPIGAVAKERRHFHRRFDDQHERHMVGGIKRVMTSAGPYKSTRLHDTRTICRGIEWHAIGDRTEITRLLAGVMQIGARRGVGYGEVAEWLVDDAGDADRARMHRPLPADYARAHGAEGMVMPWGLVPPSRLAPVECVMPDAS